MARKNCVSEIPAILLFNGLPDVDLNNILSIFTVDDKIAENFIKQKNANHTVHFRAAIKKVAATQK